MLLKIFLVAMLASSLFSLSAGESHALVQDQKPSSAAAQAAEAENLNKAGYNFSLQRNFKKALDSYLSELPLRRATSDKLGEAWALNLIGETYRNLDDS